MKIIISILLFLIMVPQLSFSKVNQVTSLPVNITSANVGDTFLVVVDSLETRKNAFDFASGSHDVFIDLNNKTFFFGLDGSTPQGSSSPNGDIAFKMSSGNIYNILIKNGRAIHNPPPESTLANHPLWAKGTRFGNVVHDIKFENIYFKVIGRNSQIAMKASRDVYNIDFIHCQFDAHMTALRDRQYWVENSGIAIAECNNITYPNFKYHVNIVACSTITSYWSNVYLQGDSLVAIIRESYLKTDARNDNPGTTPPYNATECYAISLRIGGGGHGAARVKVYGNSITVDTSYAGGRGIFVSGLDGIALHPDSCIYIGYNDIYVHQGFDGQFKTQVGIIFREDWEYAIVEFNNIIVVSKTNNTGSSYGDGEMSGLRFTANTGHHFIFRNNYVRVQILDNLPSNLFSRGACIISDETELNQDSIIIENNIFETNVCFVRWGGVNNSGGFFDQKGNTYKYLYGNQAPVGFYNYHLGRVGSSDASWESGGSVIDPIFIGTSDTSIYIDETEDERHRIWLKSTVSVKVMDSLGIPIKNALVEIINSYLQPVNGITDINGQFKEIVSYWYETNIGTDSTMFNPFLIKVSYGNQTKSKVENISWNNKDFNIYLGNIQEDIYPPSKIENLRKQ